MNYSLDCNCPAVTSRRPPSHPSPEAQGAHILPAEYETSLKKTPGCLQTLGVKGLVRPAAQRGHGPARLDGTRERATVAGKVMKSGETAGQGNGHPCVPTACKRSAQARSWKPGRRRQGCGRLANASPVRDERIANLEQRGPRSGDAGAHFQLSFVRKFTRKYFKPAINYGFS